MWAAAWSSAFATSALESGPSCGGTAAAVVARLRGADSRRLSAGEGGPLARTHAPSLGPGVCTGKG